MQSIFSSRQWCSSPKAYWTIEYEHKRDGADMLYRFKYTVWLASSGGWYYNAMKLPLYLNGSNVETIQVKTYNSGEKGWSKSGTTGWYRVSNKTSGTTSFYAQLVDTGGYAQASWNVQDTSPTYNLTVDPAYTTVSQTIRETGDNYFYINWSTTDARDYTQYSLNNGAWVDANDTVASDNKSGYYRVGNLAPNTTYNIKTRCRRTDSQLWSETSNISITTLASPYISALSDFNIGTSFSCSIYNPKGRDLVLHLYANDVADIIIRNTNANGTYTFVTTENENNELYNTIPNAKNGKFRIGVVCNDLGTTNWSNISVGNKTFYTVENDCKPTASLGAVDINPDTIALTGNSSKLIKYFSNVRATLTANAYKSANVSSKAISCGDGQSGSGSPVVFENVESSNFTGLATDTRGYTAIASKSLTLIEYIRLTLNTEVYRMSPTSSDIVVKFNGNYFNGSFGQVENTLTLKYRYKENTSGVWSNWIDINPVKNGNRYSNGNTPISLGTNFDYKKSYDFEFVALDKLYTTGEISSFITIVGGESIFDWGKDDFNINGKLNLYETSIIRHIANILYPTGSIYISLTQSLPEWLAGEWEFLNSIVSGGTTYYVYRRIYENERIYYNNEILLFNGEEIFIENTLLKGSDVL